MIVIVIPRRKKWKKLFVQNFGEGRGQPRPQGFSLKKWVGPPHPFFEGKSLGTRLGRGVGGVANKSRYGLCKNGE